MRGVAHWRHRCDERQSLACDHVRLYAKGEMGVRLARVRTAIPPGCLRLCVNMLCQDWASLGYVTAGAHTSCTSCALCRLCSRALHYQVARGAVLL